MKKVEIILEGLGCAHCAGKIEDKVKEKKEIQSANLNFITKKLALGIRDEFERDQVVEEIIKIIDDIEPGLDKKISYQTEKKSIKHTQSYNKSSISDCCDNNDDIKNENSHEHSHEVDSLKVLIISISIYIFGIVSNYFGLPKSVYLISLLIAYVLSGYKVITSAVRNIVKGRVMDENFLMTIATIGAIAIGEYPEAVGVMLFYGVGEYLESKAVNKSRKNIENLMNIKPEVAHLLQGDEIISVSPENVDIGDKIVVKVGEKVPLDGIIVDGESRFDTAAITGESVLRSISRGEEVISGIINKNSVVTIEVTKRFEDSTVSKILEMVENATTKKSKTENFITVFARYYTPIVVGLAVIISVLPAIFLNQPFDKWLYRGLIFLVVSCPCALVLSIPLSYFSGIGVSSKNGILVKGSNYLEALKNLETVVLDKTGTLTKGVFKVTNIVVEDDIDEKELLKYAYIAESRSTHPIATSISNYFKNEHNNFEMSNSDIEEYEEISANGVKVIYSGKEILAGNARLLNRFNITFSEIENSSTKVYVAVDKKYFGCLEISDEIKEDSYKAIDELKNIGVENIIMLTGDSKSVASEISNKLGIKKYYSNLLPNKKVEILEEIIYEKEEKTKVAFIGDGINDAPVIARADIGISMGGVGSDAAIEASDIVIMTDEVSKLATAVKISRKTSKIVWQNIIFAIGIKVLIMILSIFGLANMWIAIFADVGVAVLAVLNSLRIMKFRS
ncbi:heavy metal translocating P-type ATPase [Peptostreptococcus faecalis]|uniref:heavy metal translocating P-type ATPase n=1 Tax=Peptostreptococcus faecalis TaxID=2045015 RepID=UPI000C7E2D0A|nr:heavy metal translocating P-type ATPase [Peptostreptococcus faecalis]